MAKFNVTYEIWSHEAAECGETDEHGFELEGGSLRDAIEAVFGTRTSACDGIECIEPSSSVIENARWITVINGTEFKTGDNEQRSLHIPDCVTGASRRRIAKLMGVHNA